MMGFSSVPCRRGKEVSFVRAVSMPTSYRIGLAHSIAEFEERHVEGHHYTSLSGRLRARGRTRERTSWSASLARVGEDPSLVCDGAPSSSRDLRAASPGR